MCNLKALITFVCGLGIWATAAHALTIDEFLGDGVVSSAVPNVSSSMVVTSASAIGGNRTIFVIKNSAGPGVTRLESVPDPEFSGDTDYSLGYTQGVHTGQGIITWDAEGNPSALTVNGLGAVDIAQDGGTFIQLGLKFFDFPASQSVDLAIRLYDSTNSSGLKYSDVAVTLNQAISVVPAFSLNIPLGAFLSSGSSTVAGPNGTTFSAVTSFGPSGPVNIGTIGALQLIINGLTNSNAPDLTIDYLKTDGRCSLVPNAAGKVVDDCAVCLDDANANAGRDQCGTCLFGPPGYSYEQNKILDVCGICGGSATSSSQCGSVGTNCTTVSATSDILEFEIRLLKQAKTLRKRFNDDVIRAKQAGCAIKLNPAIKNVTSAYKTIQSAGKDIFKKGITVCGDSCATLTYAEQVQALKPTFSKLEKQTSNLARAVKQCYKVKRKGGSGGGAGVTKTIGNVQNELNKLVEDCRKKKVCPPGVN